MFSESLTVRILGESSDLQRELESVANQLEDLQSRMTDAGHLGEAIGVGLGRASLALPPLQQVSALLNVIGGQARQLSQTTITFNVQPAINALQRLSAMIQAVAAQVQALAGGIGIGGGGFMPEAGPVLRGPGAGFPGFAQGGPVEGAFGVDQVPARLTAGEFVISREASRRLGLSFLSALNSGRATPTRIPSTAAAPASVAQTTHYLGGVTIQVRDAVEINDVMRDLRFQGAALRNRRG